jgi:NAD(P)-dependent dehydrogenase (short-subunit alcohol dehydrogenase family)
VSAILDTILDRTVVPGYTSAGFRVRRALWDDPGLPRMDGKVVVITGATAGLGLAAAEGFAALGASLRLAARDAGRGEAARERIVAATGNADVAVGACDVSDMASVRAYAAHLLTTEPRIDVLVNNAGVLLPERRETPAGLEVTFATNVLGPFLLTNLLLGRLRESAPSRVITVSSGGMYTAKLDVDDLQTEHRDYDGPDAYARTKRAEVILTELWADRLRGTGVAVHAMHPGWADTPGVETSLPRFHRITRPLLRTPEQGADTIVWLGAADEPAASTGGFWHDRRVRPTHRVPWTKETREDRARLWAACAELSGWTEE